VNGATRSKRMGFTKNPPGGRFLKKGKKRAGRHATIRRKGRALQPRDDSARFSAKQGALKFCAQSALLAIF